MAYITQSEYDALEFDRLEGRFSQLEARARIAIDLYTRSFYHHINLENEPENRKAAVKLAMAFQMLYLDKSGIMTAEDRSSYSSINIGRTTVSYKDEGKAAAKGFNLSQDAIAVLNSIGFYGLTRAVYDR